MQVSRKGGSHSQSKSCWENLSEVQTKFLNVEDSHRVKTTEFQHNFKDVENWN